MTINVTRPENTNLIDAKYTFHIMVYTIVWENFTVGYFHVKIVCGKIFPSLGVSDNELFYGLTSCSVVHKFNA